MSATAAAARPGPILPDPHRERRRPFLSRAAFTLARLIDRFPLASAGAAVAAEALAILMVR